MYRYDEFDHALVRERVAADASLARMRALWMGTAGDW